MVMVALGVDIVVVVMDGIFDGRGGMDVDVVEFVDVMDGVDVDIFLIYMRCYICKC